MYLLFGPGCLPPPLSAVVRAIVTNELWPAASREFVVIAAGDGAPRPPGMSAAASRPVATAGFSLSSSSSLAVDSSELVSLLLGCA